MPFFLVEGIIRQPNIGVALTVLQSTPNSRFLATIEAESPQSAIDTLFSEYQEEYKEVQSLSARFQKGELTEEETQIFLGASEPIGKDEWVAKEISHEKFVAAQTMISNNEEFQAIKQQALAK